MSAMFASLRACARSPLSVLSLTTRTLSALPRRPMPLPNAPLARMLPQIRSFHPSPASSATLNQAMKRKKPQSKKIKESRSPLLTNSPQKKGVCSQIFIMKPKKPNSAKRKVARIKLSNGSTLMAYIQGEGHNLQEHSVVMIRGGRAQDLPGVKYKIVRGALDFGGVIGRQTARSRYGAKKPKK